MQQVCKTKECKHRGFAVFKRLLHDESGQAMTEYVILVSVAVAIAAWLYFPDNGIYQGFRHIFNKTSLILGWPGP